MTKMVPINYNDFLKANVINDYYVTDQKLRTAFNLFDIDGNGTIDLQEIQYLLGGCEDIEENDYISLLSAADLNGDGEISFDEFKQMMYVMYLSKK